jgi:spore cortex formation protein SpoVR/YcgB (stage V sporulation)
VQPSKTGINPYYLGIKMYEDIEERYNNPTEEMKRVNNRAKNIFHNLNDFIIILPI